MLLKDLPKLKAKNKKRIGRGLGSGKGKTGGRGTKGQKARGKIPASFTGGGLPLYRKLPLNRGWGNMKKRSFALPINIDKLNVFKNGDRVDLESLIKAGLLSESETKRGVKILGKGELKSSLEVNLPVSSGAKEAIIKAGGKIV